MSDRQAVADRAGIGALRGEPIGAVMCDYERLAPLFTHDGAMRIPAATAAGVVRVAPGR